MNRWIYMAMLPLLAGCVVGTTADGVTYDDDPDAGPLRRLDAGPPPTQTPPLAPDPTPHWRVKGDDAGTAAPRDAGVTAPRDAGVTAPRDVAVATPDVYVPPVTEPCGRYAGWNIWTCIDASTRVRCVGGALQRETCARGCVGQPVGVDDYCAAPSTGEPCGRYAGWNIWSCIDAVTRVRCIGGSLQRETCSPRCVVQPVGVDDYCASASSPPPADRCTAAAATCGGCTPIGGCGYCRDLGRCFLGDAAGPDNGACTYANWAFNPPDCDVVSNPPLADACGSSTTCDACTPRSGCGYCRATGRCQTGNSAGPSTNDCPIGQWAWETTQCSGVATPDAGRPPVVDAGSPIVDAGRPPVVDAGSPVIDAGRPPVIDAGVAPPTGCVGVTPSTGYCQSPGACNLSAPRTSACDSGAAYDFYGAEYCSARATLIIVSAGWCGACQEEAPQIESMITRPYASRGLRVVSLLTENSDRSPATPAFCQRWQSRFGLSSRMVVDPGETIMRSVRVSAFPFAVLIDHAGRIRMAEAAPRLSRIQSLVDTILREP